MTLENFILALADESRRLPSNGVRLLLHVVAKAIETGAYTVTLSDRKLCEDLGIARSYVGIVKGSIAHLVKVHASKGLASTFTVPQHWFAVQPWLFSTDGGPVGGPPPRLTSTPVALSEGHQWPSQRATTGPVGGPTGPVSGPPVALSEGQVALSEGHTGPVGGPPTTQNQQVTDGAAHRVLESSISSVARSWVYRVLDRSHVRPQQRPAALQLSNALQHYMREFGNPEVGQNPPQDAVLARCLEVADISELLQVLRLAKPRNGRPRGYGWFLVVFIENLKGISREQQAVLREGYRLMRTGKPTQYEDAGLLTPEAARLAFQNVKSIR